MKGHCPTCGRKGVLWTRDAIADAMREWFKIHGWGPSAETWLSAGHGHPTSHTVRRVFGSFAEGREYAGLPNIRKNSPAGREWTDKDIVGAMFEWTYTHGAPPKAEDWKSPAQDRPTTAVVRRVFGTWTEALLVAGYPAYRMFRTRASYAAIRRERGETMATA